jgi:hypothetical protein
VKTAEPTSTIDTSDLDGVTGDLSSHNHKTATATAIYADCQAENESPEAGKSEGSLDPQPISASSNTDNATSEVVVNPATDATVTDDHSEAGSLAPASSLPVPRKRPSPERLMRQVRRDLGIIPHTSSLPIIQLSLTQEEDLKAEIVRFWKQRQRCEEALAPLLYKLCGALRSPGLKGKGFIAWLQENHIPKATAYRWIERYAQRKGLLLPYKKVAVQKPKPVTETSTLSQVGQPTSTGSKTSENLDTQPDHIPAPGCLAEIHNLIVRYLGQMDDAERSRQWQELVSRVQNSFPHLSRNENQQEVAPVPLEGP